MRRFSLKASPKKKIIWLYPFALDSALPKRDFLEILHQLANNGYDIHLMAMRSKIRFRQDENVKIKIITLPLGGLPIFSTVMFAFAMALFLPIYILKFKPNFVVVRPDLSVFSILPFCIKKLFSPKLVLDVRSTPVETHGLRGFLQTFMFSPSLALAKHSFKGITVISPMMKNELCSTYKLNPNLVGVWASGVSTELFNPEKWVEKSQLLKKKLGLADKYVVFYHGIFTANRGLAECIKAILNLKSLHPDVTLFLLGTGAMTRTLHKIVDDNDLKNNVIIHSSVPHHEVPAFIGMSDICIIPLPDHPFWRNQSPLKLLEYLAMGKVVIATDIPAHRMVIGESPCGIYINSIEPSKIAESIIYGFENRHKLFEQGRIGRQIVTREYDWTVVAEKLDDFLCSIASNV